LEGWRDAEGGQVMNEELKNIAEDNWLTRVANYVPSAWLGHAPFLRFLLREMRPKVFVELGTHNGFSYFVACQTIAELDLPTKAFAVDHWDGDKHAGVFEESVYTAVVELNRQYSHFSNLLKMSFYEARASVPDGIDLLHIDGLHTYEAVKEDFETWLPKMNHDGIILLHDIHVRHGDFGVYRLWAELKSQYKTIEFTGSYGLGVLFLGAMPSGNIALLRDISDSGQSVQIHGVFGALGDVVIQKYRSLTELEMKGIQESRSWRLTAPLRKLFSITGSVKNKPLN
jgi:Methyltransferase domain